MKRLIIVFASILLSVSLYAQKIDFKKANLEKSQTNFSIEKVEGIEVLKVLIDTTIKTFDEPTFVKIKDLDFANGVIEVKVWSRIVNDAPAFARGFIGLAFRIDEHNSKFESIYIRPTNGRAEDQVRRNHSVQYFSYPDYKFDRLRKEDPEKYESYADMGLNEWITIRVEVKGTKAKLFINNNKNATLVVNDLKLGENQNGSIGLWVGNYTEGYFKDLIITKW